MTHRDGPMSPRTPWHVARRSGSNEPRSSPSERGRSRPQGATHEERRMTHRDGPHVYANALACSAAQRL
jgi:hypothetical protein